MGLIMKSDVKNHLSPHFRTKIHLCELVTPPDATGFCVAEPDAVLAGFSGFAKDFFADHSISGAALTTVKLSTDPISPQPPTVSKSAQA